MVFIGSRKELRKISSHFENVWISFIHAFNPLENDEAQMKALLAQAEILRNEVVKKNNTINDQKVKETLDGLWTLLEAIRSQLAEMVENMPEMEEIEFSLRKKNVKKEIKRAKGEITLCADALEEYEKERDLTPKQHLRKYEKSLKEYEKTRDMTPEQLSRRQFFKRTTSIAKKSLALMLVGSSGLTAGIYTALLELSKDLPLKGDGLAILISYRTDSWWDAALKPFGKLFIPAYVTRVEIAFGQRANIVKTAATSQDLFDMLHDKNIQNIVVFGHGSWHTWDATDREVPSKELNYDGWKNDQKKGLFVKHTCGDDRLKKYSALLFNKEKFKALEKECEQINKEMRVLDFEINFRLKFDWEKEWIVLYWKEGVSWLLDSRSLTTKWNDQSMFDNNKKEVLSRAKKEFGESPSFPVIVLKIISLFNNLESYLKEYTYQREDERQRFGTPQYPRDRIKGWEGIAGPWNFMIDVFGDRKLDQLYAKK